MNSVLRCPECGSRELTFRQGASRISIVLFDEDVSEFLAQVSRALGRVSLSQAADIMDGKA